MSGVTGAEPRTDGRHARRDRTRAAVVDALVALIRDGELVPTGARIAERAGISTRALWSNFTDLEAVYDATGRWLLSLQGAGPIPADLPRAERIERYCARRVEAVEAIAPFGRANRVKEPTSAALRRNRGRFVERIREEVEQVFAPELARAGEHGADYAALLTVACSWSHWAVLREDLDLDVERAGALMRRSVTALLDAAVGGP